MNKKELQEFVEKNGFVYVVDDGTGIIYKVPASKIDFDSSSRKTIFNIEVEGEILVSKTIEEAMEDVKQSLIWLIEQKTELIEDANNDLKEIIERLTTIKEQQIKEL